MRSKGVIHCAACGEARWCFSEAAYIRGILENGEPDLAEDRRVVKILCHNCGYLMLFDAETWRFEPRGTHRDGSKAPCSEIGP